MGGEAGVGGTTIPTFTLPARGTTPLAFAPGLSARLGGGGAGSSGNNAFDNVSRAEARQPQQVPTLHPSVRQVARSLTP